MRTKLWFREWMITIVKKCKWNKYKLNQKLVNCMLLRKKIIIILWHSFEILVIKKCQKSLFCRHFCKHCFSCSSLIPAKYLYVSIISVAKHSVKRVVTSDVSVIKLSIFWRMKVHKSKNQTENNQRGIRGDWEAKKSPFFIIYDS